MRSVTVAVAAGFLLAVPQLLAQGSIADGDVIFTRGPSPFDDSPAADFTGVSDTGVEDHVFEIGWAYRVAGDTRELFFPVPTTQSYSGDRSNIFWADVDSRGLFSAREVSTVVDPGASGDPANGYLVKNMILTNLTDSPLTIDLFHVLDVDVQPGAADDSARLVQYPYTISIGDAAGNFADYLSPWADAYLVRPFGAGDVFSLLGNGTVDDFDNTGLPFPAGDVTVGWQFSLTIHPCCSPGNPIFLAVNATLRCNQPAGYGVFCDGFESGDRSLWHAAP